MTPSRFITIQNQGILHQSAIVCDEIALQHLPILYAERSDPEDEEDSGWQFLCGQNHDGSSAEVWGIQEVLDCDSSLIPYIEFRPGSILSRKNVTNTWQISSNRVKIHFKLRQNEDGYPPVAVESVWGQKTEPEGYVFDNIPFFEHEATLGDIVSVKELDGILWFERILKPSTNSLLRALFFDGTRINEVRQGISNPGCESEAYPAQKLIAISLPSDHSLKAVREYLQAAANQGWLDYEESILRHET